MFANNARVLLILPQEVLDRARVLAGKATSALMLAVSLQMVLRAILDEGLKREGDRKLFGNIEDQARAVRRLRSLVGRGRAAASRRRARRDGGSR